MFRLEGGRPNDRRGFLHKSFIGRAVGGVAKRVFASTPVGQAVTLGASLIKRPARPVAPRTTTARPTFAGQQGKEIGRELKFGGDAPGFRGSFAPPEGPCVSPAVRDPRTGLCRTPKPGFRAAFERIAPGGATGFFPAEESRARALARAPVGEAVMGRYGAALEPGVMMIERSVCLPGMNLGDDGLCYNKGAITNKPRQWPRGRRPLLTGGDMRAIGVAARAGAKLDRTTKRLRTLGMMKALPKGRGPTRGHAHAKQIAAVSVPS